MLQGFSRFLLICCLAITGCKKHDNSFFGKIYHDFSSYYNTYYNAEKKFNEATKNLVKDQSYDENTPLDIFFRIPKSVSSEKFKEVEKKTSIILDKHPNSVWADNAIFLLGKSYYYQRDYLLADRKFKELISNYPKSELIDESLEWYARSLVAQGLTIEAQKALNALINSTKTEKELKARASFLMAELFLYRRTSYSLSSKNSSKEKIKKFGSISRDEYEEAVSYIKSGLEIKSNDNLKARAAFILGRIYDELFLYRAAREAYQMSTRIGLNDKLRFAGRIGTARNFVLEKKYKEALNEYQWILYDSKHQKRSGDIRYEMAAVHLKQNRDDKAMEMYFQIVKNNPKTDAAAKSFFQLGQAKELYFKDYYEASVLYDSAILAYSNSSIKDKIKQAAKRVKKILDLKKRFEIITKLLELGIQEVKEESSTVNPQEQKSAYRNRSMYRISETQRFLNSGGKDPLKEFQTNLNIKKKEITYLPPKDSVEYHQYQKELISVIAKVGNFFHVDTDLLDSAITWYRKAVNVSESILKNEKHLPKQILADMLSIRVSVMYSLSVSLVQRGHVKEASFIQNRIIKEHPNTVFAGYIRKERGEKISIKAIVDPEEYIYELSYELKKRNKKDESMICLLWIIKNSPNASTSNKALYTMANWYEENEDDIKAMFLYRLINLKYKDDKLNKIAKSKVENFLKYEKDVYDILEKEKVLRQDSLLSHNLPQDSLTSNEMDTSSTEKNRIKKNSKNQNPITTELQLFLPKLKEIAHVQPNTDSLTYLIKNKTIYNVLLENEIFDFSVPNKKFIPKNIGKLEKSLIEIIMDVRESRKKESEKI